MAQYPPTVVIFEQELGGIRDLLRSRLTRARALFQHAGNKGSYVEDAVRDILRQFLPRSMGVGHGEVIDMNHRRSGQLDVVVACPEHPNWYRDGSEPSLFLIEGVAAVGEIKSVLTASNLEEQLSKAAQFRTITPERDGHCEVLAGKEEADRYYRSPAYFVVALESELAIETIAERVSKWPTGERSKESLDGVFVLDRGFVVNFGNGASALTLLGPDGESSLTGYWHDDKDALMMLMRWLPLVLAAPTAQLPVLPRYVLALASSPKEQSTAG